MAAKAAIRPTGEGRPNLADKVAVVTGGGSGIGKEICLLFAEAGATVVVPEINLENAEQTAGLVEKRGPKALAIQTDVARQQDVDDCFSTTLDAFGKVDILINKDYGTRI